MRTIGMISSALLLFSASEAGAVCSLAKMRGLWQFHAINNTHDENGVITSSYVEKCQFRVNAQGTITEDSCADSEGSFYETFSFTVDRSCALHLETEFPCFYDGQFQGNQKLATGIGACAGLSQDSPDPLYFSLVKGGQAAGVSSSSSGIASTKRPRP